MNIKQEIEKIGLSEEQYEQCLNDICDKLNGLKDIEWAEIKDKYNLPWNIDVLRKSSGTLFGGFGVFEYYKNKQNPSFIEQMESIRREKQKLSDERTALRKASRDNARGEVNFEILKELISKNGKETFEYFPTVVEDNGNDLIVCLSDLHIGLNAKSEFGNYNPEIAKDRLVQYLKEILLIQNVHKSQNVYVVCLGDLISGNIHPTIQLENRENVVQQVQMAAEYISAFLYELSGYFENVYISDVPGNHSRIGLKENVLRDERLDDLIIWYAKAKLEHLDNVIFLDDKYDTTLSFVQVRNREYIICHGDFDSFSESGLNKLCMFIGHIPTGVFMGHLHHCSFDDINNVKLIRSGSFMGTCDDYTISKRLYSKPSQMVCVADNKGIKAFYPIFLD